MKLGGYAWLTLAGVAFVVCGSLVPFHFEPVPFAEVGGRFTHDLWLNRSITSRSDVLANVLLMIPVAFCAAGALWPRLPGHRAIALVVAISLGGAALSLSMEFIQTFSPERVVSLRDVIAEAFGACVGAVAWLWIGPAITDRIRQSAEGRRRLSTAERWLLVYTALFAVWQLTPLDLTLDPSVILHKYRQGRLFTGLTAGALADVASMTVASAILQYVPIGLAASLFWRPIGRRRAFPVAMALGVMAVCALECSHLFLESRAIELPAMLAGLAGVAAGVLVVRAMSSNAPAAPVPVAFGPAVACVAWAAVIVWSQWYPFNFISDGKEALIRLHQLASLSPPAAGGSRMLAITSTFLMALPLGLCVRRALGPGARVGAAAATFVVTAVVGLWCGVEFGLALLPAGAPGLADVPVATVGAAAGLWLGGL